MKEEIMNTFNGKMTEKLGNKFELKWDIDRKGVVCGWCRLADPEDIYKAAEIVVGFKGRVMTISSLNTPVDFTDAAGNVSATENPVSVIINYHFFFEGINCTVSITLPDNKRSVKSITPVLKSADWHEREMQELFNIKLQGHPDPRRLFLDESISMDDHTMIPLSEAMDGASTSTLWEKIMKSETTAKSDGKEEDNRE